MGGGDEVDARSLFLGGNRRSRRKDHVSRGCFKALVVNSEERDGSYDASAWIKKPD